MKKDYTGISKNQSIRFKKHTYLLSITESDTKGYYRCNLYSYGFIDKYEHRTKRKGWYEHTTLLTMEEIKDTYELK